jgi:hypothetical protein
MSKVSSWLGSDNAQTVQSQATAAQKKASNLYGQYGEPQIQQNWAISQAMVPWLSALSTGNYANSGSGGVSTSNANTAPDVVQQAAANGGIIKYDPATGNWSVHKGGADAGTWGQYNPQTGTIGWTTYKNPASIATFSGLETWTPQSNAGVNLGEVPQFMRVDVNNPYTPQELAGQQTLTDIGLSGYRNRLNDQLSTQMAQRGLSGSSAAITGSMGVEDAYQRSRATEQAKLSENLYNARQNARTEAAKNFYNVLAQITGDTGASNWASILSGQGQIAQGQANQAQAGYQSNISALGSVLGSLFTGGLGGGSGGVSSGTTPYDATPTGNTGGIDWGYGNAVND